MEAAMMHASLDRTISSNKSHSKNRNTIHQNPIFSNPAAVFRLSHLNSTGGLLQPPPPPPPFLSQSYPPYNLQQSPQPPLLPLPIAAARGLSCPPANRKTSHPNKSREVKKSKPRPKKVESKSVKDFDESGERRFRSERRLGVVDVFSGPAMLAVSPPPSSLPLPTFSLRRCKAEAAGGVDAGATDDLRRLLRLR